MQLLYLIIGKEKLFLYEKDNGHVERQHIQGNPYFSYDINNAKYDIKKMLHLLVDEYNLDTVAELEFIILENIDKTITNIVEELLSEYIVKKIDINEAILDVMKILNKDKKLYIDLFGINYDGISFRLEKNKLKKYGFNLLSYTLNEDNLIKFIA